MINFRTQSSPFFLFLLLSLLAASTQALPINTSAYLPSLDKSSHLLKRTVGGISISNAYGGVSGRLRFVRRAVGTVSDSASSESIYKAFPFVKRSCADGNQLPAPLDITGRSTAPIPDEPVVDALRLHLLVKRGSPPNRVLGRPDTEAKWGRWARAW